MTVTVPHHTTKEQAVSIMERGSADLFAAVAGKSVQVADQKTEWNGSTMTFSFTGKLGFISVPMSGILNVDDANVNVTCDLPPMVEKFVGVDKVASSIQTELQRLL